MPGTTIDELLDKPFDELTPEEWEAIAAFQNHIDDQVHRQVELEARLASSVDSDRFYQVIADILNA